jgi:hypothetical protein
MSKLLLFLPFLFILNCKNREPRRINTAFHHWKSRLELNEFEKKYVKEFSAWTLYLRLFDVDYDNANQFAEPIGEVQFSAKAANFNFNHIIPTVFITNRTLLNINDNKIDSLSNLIALKIEKMCKQEPIGLEYERVINLYENNVEDILIDCDWTEKTRDKYFHLINQLKNLTNKKIITTIRLHQIKFKEKTGVPPADKGLLMAYNTGDLSDPQTINSILDIAVLKSYIANLDNYPLTLDVALPIFSWAIVQRDGQAVQLIPNFSKVFLLENKEKNTPNTEGVSFEINANNKITILKNGYYNGMYLYADDVLKIEEVPLSDLQKAAELLSEHIRNKDLTVSFFSLDSTNLKRYNSGDLSKIGSVFK